MSLKSTTSRNNEIYGENHMVVGGDRGGAGQILCAHADSTVIQIIIDKRALTSFQTELPALLFVVQQ
jgi:hypothetical protein